MCVVARIMVDSKLPTALAAAAARTLAAAPLSWTAGAAILPGSIALTLALRPAAAISRTALAAESRLAGRGLPMGVTRAVAARPMALPIA
jgi:hypothetical protein